jgi:N6-adenosine-specific RNA methylase IME4
MSSRSRDATGSGVGTAAGAGAGPARPPGGFRVVYADPPWTFATYSDRGKGRSAEAHYDCLSLDRICALPVKEWAAEDALLLLWTTDPLLPQALRVVEACGFAYKTVGFYWVKLAVDQFVVWRVT